VPFARVGVGAMRAFFLIGVLPLLAVAQPAPKAAKPAAQPEGFHALALGDPAPDFDLVGIDEERYSLKAFADAKLLVVAFLSNHCPTSQAIEGRLKQFVTDFAPRGVRVVAINPNDPAALRPDELGYSKYNDSFPEMQRNAAEQKFNFPYLFDGETQKTALAYGCLATPHVFVFDAERKLRYQGRFDDSRFADPATVTAPDAHKAVEDLLAGRPVAVAETRPHGCEVARQTRPGGGRPREVADDAGRRAGHRRQGRGRAAAQRDEEGPPVQRLRHLVRALRR